MRLHDNTAVSLHRRCPRRYMYRMVFDWTTPGMPIAPGFGICWHAAMDYLWTKVSIPKNEERLTRDKIVSGAFAAFMEKWADIQMPNPFEDDKGVLKFRTPDTAARMLDDYYDERFNFISDCEIIGVEKTFCVPLDPHDPDLGYVGRRDKVIRNNGIWIVDHKTTSAYRVEGGIANYVTDSFSPDSQVDGYLYSGHMEYGKEFKGVWIDLALVHKKESRFGLVPVMRRLEHLDEWLWEVNREIYDMEKDIIYMAEVCKPTDNHLRAFPKNTDACFDFQAPCPYLDLCKVVNNPLERRDDTPDWMVVEEWSPFNEEELKAIEEAAK